MSPDNLEGRVNARVHQWVEDQIERTASGSTWANESQVSRDMIELGLLVSTLNRIDQGEAGDGSIPAEDPYFDPPVFDWERPQGMYPDDDMLVCPYCANSRPTLFRLRNFYPSSDVDAVECLYCGHSDERQSFYLDLSEGDYCWGRGVSRGPWCIMDADERRSLCERHSEPVNTQFSPDIEERPPNICRACVYAKRGEDYNPDPH